MLSEQVMRVAAPFTHCDSLAMATVVVKAPTSLGIETRALFRRQALEALEGLRGSEAARQLVIDLATTRAVDSAGLGVLVLIQRRAAEVRASVRLSGASEEVRFLLVMTRLDDRFIIESTPPS
jgi:anti-anti-sigma factor